MGGFCRWAMFEDAVSTEIDVRKLQKNYAIVVCRYSLKFCEKNVICSNSTQKFLVQMKEFCDAALQVGLSDLRRVERSVLQYHIKSPAPLG